MVQFGKDEMNIIKYFVKQNWKYYSSFIDVDDLLQECSLAVWKGLQQYDASKSAKSTYMYACMRSAVSNLRLYSKAKCRAGKKTEVSLEAQTYKDTEHEKPVAVQKDSASDIVTALAVKQALKKCSKKQREAVHQHFYEGLTYREMAEKAGKSRQYYRELVNKACTKMQTYLA